MKRQQTKGKRYPVTRGRRLCATGKVRFPDKVAAMVALAAARRSAEKGNARRHEQSIVKCGSCGGWHLSRGNA